MAHVGCLRILEPFSSSGSYRIIAFLGSFRTISGEAKIIRSQATLLSALGRALRNQLTSHSPKPIGTSGSPAPKRVLHRRRPKKNICCHCSFSVSLRLLYH